MENGIREATAAFAAALARGDAAAAAALYADDGRLLSPTAEVIVGRSEIEAYWRAGVVLGLSHVELEALELEPADGLAVEIGRYRLALDVEGRSSVAERGTYLALHRRLADGALRRAVDVFTPDGLGRGRPNREEER